MYAPVAKSAGFVSRTRLTLKTSLEPVLRKFRRYSSRGTAGLRFGLVGTIMYAPCAESAPFASDGRLSSKTSLYLHILPPLLERGGVEQSETEGIRRLEAEQTIPQSAIWLTAPFARGSYNKEPPLLERGGVEQSETEGIRSSGNRADNPSVSHLADSSLCTREP